MRAVVEYLNEHYNNIMFIFYSMVLSMCNLQKRLIRAAFRVLLQAMFTELLKTYGKAIKIIENTTNQ